MVYYNAICIFLLLKKRDFFSDTTRKNIYVCNKTKISLQYLGHYSNLIPLNNIFLTLWNNLNTSPYIRMLI